LVVSGRTPGAGIIRAYPNDINSGLAGLGPIGFGVYHRKRHTGNRSSHHALYAFAACVSNPDDLDTRRFLVQGAGSSTPVFPRLITASVGCKVLNRHPVSFARLIFGYRTVILWVVHVGPGCAVLVVLPLPKQSCHLDDRPLSANRVILGEVNGEWRWGLNGVLKEGDLDHLWYRQRQRWEKGDSWMVGGIPLANHIVTRRRLKPSLVLFGIPG
jgi:hypothetical protein